MYVIATIQDVQVMNFTYADKKSPKKTVAMSTTQDQLFSFALLCIVHLSVLALESPQINA